jgi:hypothetical protein
MKFPTGGPSEGQICPRTRREGLGNPLVAPHPPIEPGLQNGDRIPPRNRFLDGDTSFFIGFCDNFEG